MYVNSTKVIIFAVMIGLLTFSAFPMAAQIKPVECGDLELGINCSADDNAGTLRNFIVRVVNIFLILAGVIAAIFLIIGGVRYIASQGNQDETRKAKNTILFAIIGLLVIGLSAAIVNFVVRSVAGQGGQGGQADNPPPAESPTPSPGGGGGGVGIF